jgi:cytochrome c2
MDAFKLENGPHVADRDIEALLNDPAWLRSMADYFGVALAPGPPAAESASPPTDAPAAAQTASGGAAHGQTVAQRYCAVCHTLNSGGSALVGPNLYGVVGRPVASVSGYNYSDALKGHHGDWDPASLDAFLKNPRGYVPGTHMTFAGISSTRDRQDVIAYLETLGQNTGADK